MLAKQELLLSRDERAQSAPSAAATLSLTATGSKSKCKDLKGGAATIGGDDAVWSRLIHHPLRAEARRPSPTPVHPHTTTHPVLTFVRIRQQVREFLHARYGVPLPSAAEPRVVEIDWRAQARPRSTPSPQLTPQTSFTSTPP